MEPLPITIMGSSPIGHGCWGPKFKQLTVTFPRGDRLHRFSSILSVAVRRHGAGPARLGDPPDGHRVDAFSVDDVDGGGDHVVSRDLAWSAARGLLDSRHAYSVAYLVRDHNRSPSRKGK
jgi:hypothetical protein